VLSVLEAASRLQPSQVRTMVRAQHANLAIPVPGRVPSLDGPSKDALSSLREEARVHGRLVALGQAWAGTHQLIGERTSRQPELVTFLLTSVVAGEALCRILDDVADRRVLAARQEELLRGAWRAAHPAPAYFRRRPRA
jgi:hypothetical protein